MKLDRKPRPQLALAPDPGAPALALGRAHEATGPAAVVFAALIAGRMRGPALWIRPSWARSVLNPVGLATFFDPARLVLAAVPREDDILWSAEEALRSGAAPLVVAELTAPAGLTPLRRLQLAAEAGGAAAARIAGRPLAEPHPLNGSQPTQQGAAAPLCLLLSPRAGASGAVESRWRCTPLPSWKEDMEAPPRWRFERTYAKGAAPMVWETGGADLRRSAA